MFFLEPRPGLFGVDHGAQQLVDVLLEFRIGEGRLNPFARSRLQHDPWIVGVSPQIGIELPPDAVGGVVPRPPDVERETRQGMNYPEASFGVSEPL